RPHPADQPRPLGAARAEERRREGLPVGVLGLLERGDDRDDDPHLDLLAGEARRVGILVGQAHLPFAEAAGHRARRGTGPSSSEARDLLEAQVQSGGVRGRHRERSEAGGARAQPDVRREVVLGCHAKTLSARGLRPDRIDDGADPFHVSSGHFAAIDRRLIPRELTELHGRARRQGRCADADRVVEGEAEDGVRESVVLDQSLDRMGDRGRFHRSASRTWGRSAWSRISPSARSVAAPGQNPVLNQTACMPTAFAAAISAVTSSPMWTASSGRHPNSLKAASNILASGFRVRSSSEYTRTSKKSWIPRAPWSLVRWRPQLRPVFEINPIARPCPFSRRRTSRMCGKSEGGRARIAPPNASATASEISGAVPAKPANWRNAWICSLGVSSRWFAQASSRSSPCWSYARYSTARSHSTPCPRRSSSTRETRSSRIVPSASRPGTIAIVPHQSNVTASIIAVP